MQVPSGRMVSPDKMFNPRPVADYHRLEAEGITVFIEKELLAARDEIEFLLVFVGKFKLVRRADRVIIK